MLFTADVAASPLVRRLALLCASRLLFLSALLLYCTVTSYVILSLPLPRLLLPLTPPLGCVALTVATLPPRVVHVSGPAGVLLLFVAGMVMPMPMLALWVTATVRL